MKTAGSCGATNDAGRSSEPTHGWGSSAACWSVTNICSSPTAPSSTSLAFGSPCENVFETRSTDKLETVTDQAKPPVFLLDTMAFICRANPLPAPTPPAFRAAFSRAFAPFLVLH